MSFSNLFHEPPQAWPQAGHNVRPDVRAMVIRIAYARGTVSGHLILWIKLKLKISSLEKGASIVLL
ncbi:MAG TPA: hypothetical protein VHR27_03325, partial [Blastocatellia bacterium]|nr:hypothetical protein [Blastocatellia bacterium]